MHTLQHENEELRRQVEKFQATQERLREECAVEQQRLRDEAEASRRLMKDAIRAHEELQRVNGDLRRTLMTFYGKCTAFVKSNNCP